MGDRDRDRDREHHSSDEGMRRNRSVTALPEYLDLELLQSDEEKTTKEKVLEFLEGYGHHPLRHYYSFFMLLATLYVTALFLVFSLPQFYVRPPASLLITEWIIMTIFTVDYLVRFYCCAHKPQWFFDSMNMIDFFTIMPFWIEVIILIASPTTEPQKPVGLAFLRIIRLARVFRVFKVGKYTPSMKLVLLALNESKEAFVLMIILVGIIDILTASAVFYAEQTGQTFDHDNQVWYRADGSVSPFQSIFSGCWWAIVTLTTVGYGDVVPATTLGKMVGGVTVLLGVLVLAFPLSIFSSKFYNIYTLSQTQRKPIGPLPGSIPMEQLPRMVHEFDRLELELRAQLDSLKSSIDDTYSKLDHVTQLMERFKRLEALVEHNPRTSQTQQPPDA